jgi:hypothetical protein
VLSLSKAIKSHRLADFIAQEEKRGIGPASKSEVEKAISLLAKQTQSEDQTLHSASDDYSDEK